MARDAITVWLRRKLVAKVAVCLAVSLVALASGVLLLFLTFWVAYAVILIGMDGVSAATELAFGWHMRISHQWRVRLSLLFVGLLFLSRRSTRGEKLLERGEQTSFQHPMTLRLGRLEAMLAVVKHPVASAEIITDFLLIGPRLVTTAVGLLVRSIRLTRFNCRKYGPVLSHLLLRSSPVSEGELLNVFPGLDWEDAVRDLALLEEVFVAGDDIAVAGSVRSELRKLLPTHSFDTEAANAANE